MPGGKILFSRLIGRMAPYTGDDRRQRHRAPPRLLPGRAARPQVGAQPPATAIHAVALANLAELAGNVALAYSLPDDARFIVAGARRSSTLKKARGTITATSECPVPATSARAEYDVPVVMTDAAGDVVAQATLRSLVGPKPGRGPRLRQRRRAPGRGPRSQLEYRADVASNLHARHPSSLRCRVAAGAAPAAADTPQDFAAEAKLIYRVVACAGRCRAAAGLDARMIDTHCKPMAPWYATSQALPRAGRPLLAPLRPAGLPTTVVYPFGGGDLLSALITYPDATEITTISLEHAGDPTRLDRGDAGPAQDARSAVSAARCARLLVNHDSASDNMKKLERGAIPGQLSFLITGLAAHRLRAGGAHLLHDPARRHRALPRREGDRATSPEARPSARRATWVDTDYSVAFTNFELTLPQGRRPQGAG